MSFIPVSDKDPVELGALHRSWFVLRGGAFAIPAAQKLASAIINVVNRSQTIRVQKVVWYNPDQVQAGELGFPIPATVFIGALRPWAIRVDWKKIAEAPEDSNIFPGLRRPNEASIADVKGLIVVGFFVIAGLLVALKFTEKNVTSVVGSVAKAAEKTFPWALAGLAGIMLIVLRRRLA